MSVAAVDPEHEATGVVDPDHDLPEDDLLLGVPLRQIMQVRALRGVVLLVIATAILVWPGRTGRALGVMIGLAMATYATTMALEVVRQRDARSFGAILSVGVAGGFAAALLVQPNASLLTVAQVAAVIMLGLAAVTLVQVIAGGHAVAWGVSKAGALAVGGGLLLAFPETLIAAATSVVAGGLAAVALIDVFTTVTEGEAEPVLAPTTRAGLSEMATSVTSWIRHRPSVAEDRAGLMEKIYFEGPTSPVRVARFVTLMMLASAIAGLGVVADSTAVVIGAMLVAPLMTPLMGTAFSVTMGWMHRLVRSAGLSLLGMALAIGVGAVVGSVAPPWVDLTSNPQVLSRIAPTTVDLAIAVAAGAAGAFALSRRDVSDSLPGVAVAISLVPPLTVVGLCWQAGEWSAGNGALLLFMTNAAAILVAGGATFILVGAAPLQRVSAGQERWATVIAVTVALAGVVVILLLVNGSEVATRESSRAQVESVVGDWADGHDGFRVLDTQTQANGSIVVDLAGPGRPPDLDALLADLKGTVSNGTQVTVTWVDQASASVTGG